MPYLGTNNIHYTKELADMLVCAPYKHHSMSCPESRREPLCLLNMTVFAQFATIELRRREIDKHRQAQKKREHSQEEAEKDAIRKTVEGEKAWAETER